MYRLLTVISAALIAGTYGKPVDEATAIASEDYPRYAFHYAVKDPYTRDNKAQWEERDGDIVKGGYSLREADGSLRVVEYSASDGSGFNAVVKNVGPNIHPVKINQPVAVSVPAVPVANPLIAPAVPVANPLIAPAVPITNPLIAPLTYGLTPAPLSIDIPKATLYGESSLPWDPLTGSYGGWVPLPSGPRAYIISKKLVNGHLHKLIIGPISLAGKKITVRTRKN